MTSCTGSALGGFWRFWKSQLVELRLDTGREELTFTCSQRRWAGAAQKSQNRKNVYLSPYVEEPLNSKVIKCFVPEQSCVFFEFRDSYVLFLWTFYIHFTRSHIMAMVHYAKPKLHLILKVKQRNTREFNSHRVPRVLSFIRKITQL